jgi:hypothetical protein
MALLMGAFPFMIEGARLSTPDMLSALVLVAGVFVLVEWHEHFRLAIVGMTILILPDNLIFFVLLVLLCAAKVIIGRPVAVSYLSLGIVVTLLFVVHNYQLLIEHLYAHSGYSPDWSVVIAIKNYVINLYKGLTSAIYSMVLLFVSITILILLSMRHNKLNLRIVSALAMISIVLHYFKHPDIQGSAM